MDPFPVMLCRFPLKGLCSGVRDEECRCTAAAHAQWNSSPEQQPQSSPVSRSKLYNSIVLKGSFSLVGQRGVDLQAPFGRAGEEKRVAVVVIKRDDLVYQSPSCWSLELKRETSLFLNPDS